MRKPKSRRLVIEQLESRLALNSYFVSPTGSDSNTGTSASPFLTLQHGASVLHPGDILTARAGTYAGFVSGYDSTGLYGVISGTQAAPITIQADPNAAPGSVIINHRENKTPNGIDFEPGCSYITINGFTITNDGSISSYGIKAAQGTNITITNFNVSGVGLTGIFTSHVDHAVIENNVSTNNGEHGFYMSNSPNFAIVSNNIASGNASAGIQFNADITQGPPGVATNNVIEDNTLFNNGAAGAAGINLDGFQNGIVENNLIYNEHSTGIVLYDGDAAQGCINNVIANNTVLVASGGRWCININTGSTGNTLFNNILYNAGSNGTITIDSSSLPGTVSDYNVVVNLFQNSGTNETLAQWQSATGQDQHSLISTPAALFVNAGANNYQLSATSPAVDAGVSSLAGHNAPSVDIVGTSRPQGTTWDIGAYELTQSAPGVATHFSVTAPASATAGSPFSITVTALTASNARATTYTGTVHFTSSDAAALLPADYTFTAGDAGVHTFSNGVTLKTTGVQTVAATDKTTTSVTGSVSLTVNVPVATTLTITPSSGSVAPNGILQFSDTVTDQFGNPYTATPASWIVSGGGTIDNTGKFTAGSVTGGPFTVTAATSGLTATASVTISTNFNLAPNGTAYRWFGMSSVTANSNQTAAPGLNDNNLTTDVTLTGGGDDVANAYEAAGVIWATSQSVNKVTFTNGSFNATSYDGVFDNNFGLQITTDGTTWNNVSGWSLSPAYQDDLSAAAGVTYIFTGPTLSVRGIRAVGQVHSLTGNDSWFDNTTEVQAFGAAIPNPAASTLVVSGFASPTVAGVSHNFTVTALTSTGNTATGYTGTVHFTSSDVQAGLPADYTFTATDAGQHTFSAILKTAGSQSITAKDTATNTMGGSQTGITVNPAAASSFVVAGFPSLTTAGVAGTFTLTAKDSFGNTATGYSGTVHFTSSDSQAGLPANYTFVSGDAGVHTFSATLKTAGSQSITATDTATSSITGTQSGITVNAAAMSVFHINFTNSTTDTDNYAGYTDDIGLAYGPRGSGLSFGWNQDNTANARDRNNSTAPDERYDTLIHMQKSNNPNSSWMIAVPNGTYTVHLVSGDPNNHDSVYKVNVNGVLTVNGTPTSTSHWVEGTVSITVTNGFITVTNAPGSTNNKIDYIDIVQTASAPLLASTLATPVVSTLAAAPTQTQAAAPAGTSGAGSAFVTTVTPGAQLTTVAQPKGTVTNLNNLAARGMDSLIDARLADLLFSPDVKSLGQSLQGHIRSVAPADWYSESWLADAWLSDFGA